MLRELWKEHTFMSCIMLLGTASLVLQGIMALSLKGYVKASANMKTTRKKVMLNLKSQFEAIYGMDYQVRNISAYVDKYLLKLRFLGFSYSAWEKVPFLTAGLLILFAGGGIFYGYLTHAGTRMQIELLFSCGVMLVCLFVFYHIFGIKSKKEQIQIQLADYLENYLTNRLIRNRVSSRQPKLMDEEMEQAVLTGTEGSFDEILKQAQKTGNASDIEEDMEMLKRLLREMDAERQERERRAAERKRRAEAGSEPEETSQNVEAEFAVGSEESAAAYQETADACDEGRPEESVRMEGNASTEGGNLEREDAGDGGSPEESVRMEGNASSENGNPERADACDEASPRESVRMEGNASSETGNPERADACEEVIPQEAIRLESSPLSEESAVEQREDSSNEPEVISFEEAAAKKGSRAGSVTGLRQSETSAQESGTETEAGVGKREQTAGKGLRSDVDNRQPDQAASEMAAAKEDTVWDTSLPGEAEIELLEEFVMSFLAQAGGAS